MKYFNMRLDKSAEDDIEAFTEVCEFEIAVYQGYMSDRLLKMMEKNDANYVRIFNEMIETREEMSKTMR
jgi:hypothetical protein